MARLMLSWGMFSPLAGRFAPRGGGLEPGPPPPFFAAMLISLMRRVKILPRLASSAPFLCLIVAHFEWPDMARPRSNNFVSTRDSPVESAQAASEYKGESGIITRPDYAVTENPRGAGVDSVVDCNAGSP